ncbi:MAG: hypothetical protein AAF447_12795 [Myxococcota bacterium]
MFRSPSLPLVLVLLLGFVLPACDDEEAAAPPPEAPSIGVFELPISFRYRPAPSAAYVVEVTPGALTLDDRVLMELERGRLPDEVLRGETVPALAEALASAPARSAGIVATEGGTPYATTARIVATLHAANVRGLFFRVRRGTGTEEGYLDVSRYHVRPESQEPFTFQRPAQRMWDELAPAWPEMNERCYESEHRVDCTHEQSNVAEGGKMLITLFARGNGLKIDLNRFDAPEPTGAGGGGLIEGVAAPEPVEPAEEELPPAENASFSWRFRGATTEPSTVSATMRPLCGAKPCGVVIEAEGQTPTMRVLSFLGASFPNGTEPPEVLFQVPPA